MSLNAMAIPKLMRKMPKNMIKVRNYSEEPVIWRIDRAPGREQIGWSYDTDKDYYDRVDFPCPSIRYKVDTPEVKKLREKEKGDWKLLTMDEKKTLYRTSFRLTLVECMTSTGRYKSYIGWSLMWTGVGLWLFMAFHYARNRGQYRPQMSLESRQAQLQRMIAMRAEPIFGISSKWDYEKEDWKK